MRRSATASSCSWSRGFAASTIKRRSFGGSSRRGSTSVPSSPSMRHRDSVSTTRGSPSILRRAARARSWKSSRQRRRSRGWPTMRALSAFVCRTGAATHTASLTSPGTGRNWADAVHAARRPDQLLSARHSPGESRMSATIVVAARLPELQLKHLVVIGLALLAVGFGGERAAAQELAAPEPAAEPATIRQYQFEAGTEGYTLALKTVPRPERGPHEELLRVRAGAFDRRD